MKEASHFLKKCDIDCEVGIKDTFTFTCKQDKSVQELKEVLSIAFESCNMELIHIEGGKIE
jgi:hypothetical protein